MKHPSAPVWQVRLSEAFDALALWAHEKGTWRCVGFALGLCLVALWWVGLWSMPATDGEAAGKTGFALGYGIMCFASLVAGALLMSPMVAPWVASPFLRFIDSIYLGGSAVERPPLTYVVAERRLQERRFADAAIEFERLASWHPRELRPYLDGIHAARLAGDEELAHRLFRRGRLRCPAAANQLRASLQAPMAEVRGWPPQSAA